MFTRHARAPSPAHAAACWTAVEPGKKVPIVLEVQVVVVAGLPCGTESARIKDAVDHHGEVKRAGPHGGGGMWLHAADVHGPNGLAPRLPEAGMGRARSGTGSSAGCH